MVRSSRPLTIVSLAALACASLAIFLCPGASAAGTISAWGYNFEGQIGNGSFTTTGCKCVPTPTAVSGISTAVEVSAGSYFAVALLSDGTVRTWGSDSYGRLGDGSEVEKAEPVPVPGVSNAKQVVAGSYNGYALLDDGTVMAWGADDYGQLGLGTSTGPEKCAGPCSKVARPIPGLSNVVSLAAGGGFALAELSDGTLMSWGYGAYGEQANGSSLESSCDCVDHPVPLIGIGRAVSLSGGYYEAAAVLADGSVLNWGSDEYGQLGSGKVGTNACECELPVAPASLAGVVEATPGEYHSLALLADGTVRAWGENDGGELGIGSPTETGCYCVPTPVAVPGLSGVRQISAGEETSMALLGDGTVRAWGPNYGGQNGNGGTGQGAAPGPVSATFGVSQIASGDGSGYALIGPSQGLSVAMAGAGSGTVGTRGLLCPSLCSNRYTQGSHQVLIATPAGGTGFAGFSGACSGTGVCDLSMNADQAVTATFGPASRTKIGKSKVSSKKKRATFSFSAPGAITGYECKLIRPLAKKNHGAKRSVARRKPAFTSCKAPKVYKGLKPGAYAFSVRALDSLGPDAHPAVKKFKIAKPHRKHRG